MKTPIQSKTVWLGAITALVALLMGLSQDPNVIALIPWAAGASGVLQIIQRVLTLLGGSPQ